MPTIEKASVATTERLDKYPSHTNLLHQTFDTLLKNQNNPQFDNSRQEYSQKLQTFWQNKTKELEPFTRINLDNLSIVYPQRTSITKLENGNTCIKTKTLSENIYTEITPTNNLVSIISEIKSKPDTREENRISFNFKFNKDGLINFAEKKKIENNKRTDILELKMIQQITFNEA